MALCKTSNEIESIRGRFGGVYFKHDNSGQHIQAMPRSIRKASMETPIIRPVHSPGGSRAAYIKSWTQLARFYAFMYAMYFAMWLLFARKEQYKTKKGDIRKLVPWGWFTHYNVRREAEGLPIYWRPPRSPQHLPELTLNGNDWPIIDEWGIPTLQNDTLMMYERGYGETFNGKPWYISDVRHKCLWWSGLQWVISSAPGEYGDHYWYKSGEDPVGIYNPWNPDDDIAYINY